MSQVLTATLEHLRSLCSAKALEEIGSGPNFTAFHRVECGFGNLKERKIRILQGHIVLSFEVILYTHFTKLRFKGVSLSGILLDILDRAVRAGFQVLGLLDIMEESFRTKTSSCLQLVPGIACLYFHVHALKESHDLQTNILWHLRIQWVDTVDIACIHEFH